LPNHDLIYLTEAERYDRLIARMDPGGNIPRVLRKLVPLPGELQMLDMGAGTGRLSCLLAPHVKSILATDASPPMLEVAAARLTGMGWANWKTRCGSHLSVPAEDQSFDLITAGWTLCYLTSARVEGWEAHLEQIMKEIHRLLRPGGTVVIFENFGTGAELPDPPDFLTPYYRLLETKYGFSHEWIRTDYHFESQEEAEELSRFFFGEELAEKVRKERWQTVPECAGVWWKRPTVD
jgi:ubiquinone/menaquinone biosynthesis C-methylase UbiE